MEDNKESSKLLSQEKCQNSNDKIPHVKFPRLKEEANLKHKENLTLRKKLKSANTNIKMALMSLKQQKINALNFKQVRREYEDLKTQVETCLEKRDYQDRFISKLLKVIENLELELKVVNKDLTAERHKLKKMQISSQEKEIEFYNVCSYANEINMVNQKKLYEDKKNLMEKLEKKESECRKLIKENESLKNKNKMGIVDLGKGNCKKQKTGKKESGLLKAEYISTSSDSDINRSKVVRRLDFKEQLRANKSEEPYFCKRCNIQCSSRSAYKKHLRKHAKH